MNTTLCFSIIWILPMATLLTGCAGSTATSISFENYTDDSIPTRLLHEEPSSTEGIQGSLQEIDAKPGASPPEERTPPINQSIAISESAAEERNPFEAEATLILNMLHAELLKSKPHLITSDDVWAELKEFVEADNQRKQEYEIMKVLFDLAKDTPLAQESTAAMIHAETKTAQVLSNQVATSTIQELWEEFKQEPVAIKGSKKQSLPDAFLDFVRQDSVRNNRYLRWLTWRRTNFGENGKDFTLHMIHKPSEKEADGMMTKLWKNFLKLNELPRKAPTIDLLDSYLQDLLKPKFFEFVRATPQRSELWMQWLNCKADTGEALAKEELTPAVIQETTETKNVLSNHQAKEILQQLWTDFLPLSTIVRDAGVKQESEIIFLTFVALDRVRQARYDELRKWHSTNFGTNDPKFTLHWLRLLSLEAESTKVVASKTFTSSYYAKILVGLQRSTLWSEFRESWLEKNRESDLPLTYDRLGPDLKRELDGPFLEFAVEQLPRRTKLLAASAKTTQPAESEKPRDELLAASAKTTQPAKSKKRRNESLAASAKTTQPAGSRKRQRHSSNPPS